MLILFHCGFDCCHQYNETLNDLLGTEDFDKKKHEIKHEKIGRSTRTTVTDATLGKFNYPALQPLKLEE